MLRFARSMLPYLIGVILIAIGLLIVFVGMATITTP
jgi:hypothetical protein